MPEGQPGNVIDPYRAYNYSLNLAVSYTHLTLPTIDSV